MAALIPVGGLRKTDKLPGQIPANPGARRLFDVSRPMYLTADIRLRPLVDFSQVPRLLVLASYPFGVDQDTQVPTCIHPPPTFEVGNPSGLACVLVQPRTISSARAIEVYSSPEPSMTLPLMSLVDGPQ